ncbi:hypothetical protein Enr13x_16320 [Stieleria neptunia]|uniref:Uncharacterized protein n=1 Tax=Stieleria neptunia TaxID=2527979 RepID=A0A518HLX6_9BACT|nr:hypothetical protein [Stieleria neptunia]QDV41789.1 hypothetical protein Enr13x_16320 [Stieleria neptunia]
MKSLQFDVHLFLLGAIIALAACASGCEQQETKETIVDVDTPNGGIEIHRDENGGDVTVKVGE